jgi:hypothetical protein
MNRIISKFFLVSIAFSCSGILADQQKDVKSMVFEDQRIEGKIRRPQLVLIKAEQRPEFKPMVMQSFGKLNNITNSVNEKVIEDSPYKGPFLFNGTEIINYDP